VLLLELCEHEEERLAELVGALLQSLLEEISSSLEFGSTLREQRRSKDVESEPTRFRGERYDKGRERTHVSLDKLGEVDVPDFEGDGEGKEVDSSLVDLEALLEVLVLLQEGSVVDDDLRENEGKWKGRQLERRVGGEAKERKTDLSVGDLELHDSVVDLLGGLDSSDRLLEIDVEGPELERLEKTLLDGERLEKGGRDESQVSGLESNLKREEREEKGLTSSW